MIMKMIYVFSKKACVQMLGVIDVMTSVSVLFIVLGFVPTTREARLSRTATAWCPERWPSKMLPHAFGPVD